MRRTLLVALAGMATLVAAHSASATCYKCAYVLFVGYSCQTKTSGYDSCTKSPSANYCKMGNAMCGGGGCGTGSGCEPEQQDASLTPDADPADAIVVLASFDERASIASARSACRYVVE